MHGTGSVRRTSDQDCFSPSLMLCGVFFGHLEELAREVVRVQAQPPKSARVVSGRRHHLLRMLVDPLMCRDGRSAEPLLERRAVRTLAARRNYQTALGAFLPWFTASCCHDGSLIYSAALGPENFRSSMDVRKSGDSSHLREPDEQCLHQPAKALQHNSPFSVILTCQRSSSFCQ